MPSMFGYQNHQGPRRTPRPEEVGELLANRPLPAGEMDADDAMGPMVETAGPMPGEPDPHAVGQETSWPTSSEAALRAAILRVAGQAPASEPKPPAIGSRAQLLRLGMRPEEIDLLNATGGANSG